MNEDNPFQQIFQFEQNTLYSSKTNMMRAV
jgi:hypothetical protein